MARPIDADVFKQQLHISEWVEIDRYGNIHTNVNALNIALERSAIDAVPVIRCKDCKYGERWAPDKCYCNGFLNAWVDEDDFCAWAEPKVTK